MAQSKLGLISQAMISLGEAPVSSLTEESPAATIAANLYETLYETALSIEPWHFASKEVMLSRLTSPTNNEYAHAFQLPADYLSVTTINEGRGSNNYDIYGGQLYADTDSVLLLYVSRVEEAQIPPWFATYFIRLLAESFSIPLTDSTARKDNYSKDKDEALREARFINSTQAPIDGFYTLTDLGHSGGGISGTGRT